MGKEKIALFDTDFILKMNLIQNNENKKLIEKIVNIPCYQFFCHEQIKEELLRHDINSFNWLQEMISTKKLRNYSDKDILDNLSRIYNNSSVPMYLDMLKTACEAYKGNYFEENFHFLQDIEYITISKEQFLKKLQSVCDNIGTGKNLGELKTYVLLQLLQIQHGDQKKYIFCSDDKNARTGIVNFQNVQCISVLSSFMRLRKECKFSIDEAKSYFDSYMSFCKKHGQTTFKVQNNLTSDMQQIPCGQVFEDIFSGKVKELKNGILQYV